MCHTPLSHLINTHSNLRRIPKCRSEHKITVNGQTGSLAPSRWPVQTIRPFSWSRLSVCQHQGNLRSPERLFNKFHIGEIRYSMYSTSQHHSSLQYVQYVTISQFATVCTVRHNIIVSAKIAQLQHFIRVAAWISSTTRQDSTTNISSTTRQNSITNHL
jgi:hypothetical protein